MQQNQDRERPIIASLNYDVRKKLKISWAEYVLLDMVYHLSAKHGYCYKSISAIATDIGITFTGIKKMITRLVARELLIDLPEGLKCGAAYIDIAYLQKDEKKPAFEQSSERKTPKKHVINTKTELSSKSELSSIPSPKKSKLSSKKVNLVQQIELSSDKIYSLDKHRDISITNVILGDEPPEKQKDQISQLYYQAIKALKLPVRNHTNVKAKIDELRKELTHQEAVDYLNFMINHYERLSWAYKPQVTEALHIHAKRLQIRATFDAARKEQQKNQPVRFGAKK